ncbi:MAG: hydrogenase accessory protein HypB, partial [Azoarcus sp.]|nr:hydrogenase accessory protein HypB [Azoarcus sp.]
MCTVCGCGTGEIRIGQAGARPKAGPTVAWRPVEKDHHHHGHEHEGAHAHDDPPPHADAPTHVPRMEGDNVDYGTGPAHAHAPGLSQGQMVRIEQDILGKND